MAANLLIVSIRRRLDKGETIKANEIRMLLAMMEAQQRRIETLEQLPLVVAADEPKGEMQS